MNRIYLIIAIIILIFTVIKAKKYIFDIKKCIPIMLLGMATALAILIFPISGEENIIGRIVFSIVYSAQTIILNENLDILNRLQIVGATNVISIGIIYIISLLMPLLTVSFLLTLIDDFTSKIKLYFTKKNNVLIFSDVNEKSISMAKALNNKNTTIIFANYKKEEHKQFNQAIKNVKGVKVSSLLENVNVKRIKSNSINLCIISEDENNNLGLTLKLIEKNKLSNKKIKIYSILNDEMSRVILDSTDKGNIQLEIVNEIERTILQLLQNKPIYLNAKNNEINVLIIGCGKVGKQFLKTITWCGQIIGYSLNINVIDINANKIKETIEKECPELIPNYNYNFIEADINSKEALEELNKLKNINYAVVTLNTDEINIKEAIFLRRYFLYQDKENYNNKPIINIWIKNEEKNKQVSILKDEKKAQYDLNAFGSNSEIYYKYPIINSEMEKTAQKIHLSYDPEDTELKNYYKTEYNIKSSRATAMHLKYKLYSVLKENYTGDIEKDLHAFEEIIKDEEVFEELAKNEHNRWNAYMRSDGYRKASIEDVKKYIKTTNDYRHHLAKMHPAIDEYENLDEIGKNIGKNLKDSDRDIIRNMLKFLN